MVKNRVNTDNGFRTSEFKNLFSAMFSILYKPQLTKTYVKGFLRGRFNMFDRIRIKEDHKAVLYSKKEDKYYDINLDTGERVELDKSQITDGNIKK
jgi:hypothetical protein